MQKRLWKQGADGEQRNFAKCRTTSQFMLVQLCHHGTRVQYVITAGGGQCRVSCGLGLSCYYCCCRSCTVKGRSWVGSQTFQVAWDSRWWCRRLSAGVALGRSWIFHLAAGCFCSVSGIAKHRTNI